MKHRREQSRATLGGDFLFGIKALFSQRIADSDREAFGKSLEGGKIHTLAVDPLEREMRLSRKRELLAGGVYHSLALASVEAVFCLRTSSLLCADVAREKTLCIDRCDKLIAKAVALVPRTKHERHARVLEEYCIGA